MEKFQSNLEDSRLLRNSFRASLEVKSHGGRALFGLGALLGLPNSDKLRNVMQWILGSQTASDKIRSRKGKQPRPPVKVPKYMLSGKGCGVAYTMRMLACKQPPLKSA